MAHQNSKFLLYHQITNQRYLNRVQNLGMGLGKFMGGPKQKKFNLGGGGDKINKFTAFSFFLELGGNMAPSRSLPPSVIGTVQ
jgi:hypothetical protein